jgi:integrase
MRTTRGTKIAEGIYEDAFGHSAMVKVGRTQREKRFPADWPLQKMQAWQTQKRAELEGEREDAADLEAPLPERGTYAADLPRYLLLIKNRPQYKSDRSHLRAWLPLIGHLHRDGGIKPSHVAVAFAQWLAEGKSPTTIRHRRRVLRELYQGLDGVHAKPPIKGVKLPRLLRPHPTPVPIAMIRKVAASLKRGKWGEKRHGPKRTLARVHYALPTKTRARFLVRATTGQRPAQIMRTDPGDVDLVRRVWFVRAAKGGDPVPLPLNDEMIRAWTLFAKADAWGRFNTRSFSLTVRRHGWPTTIRPYNLRHTFAIDHLLAGTDLGDVQGLLGHRQIDTTRRFYAPVLLARLRKTTGTRKLKLA